MPMILVAVVGMTVLLQGPTTPLTGTVVAEDGAPVAGASLLLTGPTPGGSPVVSRGTSDEGGRFRFDRPAGLAPTNQYLIPTLWVGAPGHRARFRRFPEGMPGAEEPVRVVLGPPARTEVRVETPDGRPLAGARVSVQRIKSEPMPVPEPLADLAERATGPDGVAVLDAFGPEEVGSVDVIAKGFGIQPRWLDPARPGPKRVVLRPVVTLRGRLAPEPADPALARGWHIRAWTYEQGDGGRNETVGYGDATTDEQGRYRIGELAPGSLQMTVAPPGASDLLPDLANLRRVEEGRENDLDIPLRRTSTVTGRVVERGTGKPIVGMEVILFRPDHSSSETVKTDAEGRYTLRSFAGKGSVWGPRVPPGYAAAPGLNRHDLLVPEPPGRLDLGTLEVPRAAPPLRGEVRDEADRPVAGAAVAGHWFARTPQGDGDGSIAATTDAQGRFAAEGIAPGSKVTLTARLRDRATAGPTDTFAEAGAPVILTMVPRALVAVACRVLGPGGVPVPGAEVRLYTRNTREERNNAFGNQVALEGNAPIRTGPNGTYRTPKELDREGHEYRAEIAADGFQPGKLGWTPAGDGDVLDLPSVTLRRLLTIRVVAGRIVDPEGRPVAGASVSQAGDGPRRTVAITDDAGRFRLAGVYAGQALVFAEAAGFRFGGAVAGAADGAVEIRLAREGGPSAAILKPLPAPLGRAEERALARELLAPVLPQARAGALGHLGAGAIPALARIDPGRVLAMIEDRALQAPAAALQQVALGQFEDDPGEAFATIEADLDPGSRARGFLALADALPDAERGRLPDLLDRALAEARRAADAEGKLAILGRIADRWLDLGDADRAAPILREGKAALDALPRGAFVFPAEQFAEVLATIDLPAARAIFERKGVTNTSRPSEAEVRRHLIAAAMRIAALDPVGAERLLDEAGGGPNSGEWEALILGVARQMARADLPRARKLLPRLADRPDVPALARPGLVPYGLGLMGADRAATAPASARGLLDEAFAGLRDLARATDGRTYPPASILMAALLPAVERIDPDRLAERLWLAASCRPPRPQEPDGNDVLMMATLALLASRYDRPLADTIVAPALDRLPALLEGSDGWGYYDGRLFDILAAYDPRVIDSVIRELPPAARRTERTRDGNLKVAAEVAARLAAAEMLGRPIDERRRAGLDRAGFVYRASPDRP